MAKLWLLQLALLFVAALFGATASKATGWSPSEVANPRLEPARCGRPTVDRSSLCDPDDILTLESKDIVEGYINVHTAGRGAEVAVLILERMSQSWLEANANDIDVSAERFARAVHDDWGVGDRVKHDGIVVFLSIVDRVAYISRGDSLTLKLNKANIDGMISHMRPHLRSRDYEKALSTAVVEIGMIVQGKALPGVTDESETSAVFWGLLAVILGWLAWSSYAEHRRVGQLNRGRAALNSLMTEVNLAHAENAEDPAGAPRLRSVSGRNSAAGAGAGAGAGADAATVAGERIFASKSCPICLEDYVTNDEQHAQRPNKLGCGHCFCHGCLSEFLKTPEGTKCPICRAPVDGKRPPQRPAQHPTPQAPPPPPSPQDHQPSENQRPRPFWSWGAGAGAGAGGCSVDPGVSVPPPAMGMRWSRSTPELLFRIRRMHYLYPEVMDAHTMGALSSGVSAGDVQQVRVAVEARSAAVQSIVTSIQSRAAAKSAGSGGSKMRGSFGGGRSGGGGGGRW